MSSSGRLTPFALVLATGSMLVAVYAVMSRPPADETACRCDTTALESEIATLRRRVDAAERTAARGTVRRVADAAMEPSRPVPAEPAPPSEDGEDAEDGEEPSRVTPRFAGFDVPEPGVTVSQSESGALSVSNTNPALEGKVLIVQARGDDGQVRDLPITVPPVQ